jgi:hypothetical protein
MRALPIRILLCRHRVLNRSVHLNLLPDLKQPHAHRCGIKARPGAHRFEVGFVLKQECLRFAPRAQGTAPLVFDRRDNYRRPQPSLRDAIFAHLLWLVPTDLSPFPVSVHRFPQPTGPVPTSLPCRAYSQSAACGPF